MEFSGEVAQAYARHRRGFPAPVVDLLVDALGLPPDAYVLDLGCGTGRLTVPLAQRYARVVGADPSPDMLALARAGAPGSDATWLLAADRDIPRLLPGLDAVTIAQAVHLLDRPAIWPALAATLSPRGRIAVIANGLPLWMGPSPWSRRLRAHLSDWIGAPLTSCCDTDPAARRAVAAELAPHFPVQREVTYSYAETHTAEAIIGNVYSALSPADLPTDRPAFAAALTAALGPAPYPEHVTVSVLVARPTTD
jgi:trans-aconitate methyltransferase